MGKEGRLLNAVDKGPTGKLDAVADAASKFDDSYGLIAYAEGPKVGGTVRNRNANRPV